MKRFEFTVIIAGNSEQGDKEEAWIDAVESFALDCGNPPDDYESEEVDSFKP